MGHVLHLPSRSLRLLGCWGNEETHELANVKFVVVPSRIRRICYGRGILQLNLSQNFGECFGRCLHGGYTFLRNCRWRAIVASVGHSLDCRLCWQSMRSLERRNAQPRMNDSVPRVFDEA